jgi:hypothetical protein
MSNTKPSERLWAALKADDRVIGWSDEMEYAVNAVETLEAELAAVKAERDAQAQFHAHAQAALAEVIKERDAAVNLAELGKRVAKQKQDALATVRLETLKECYELALPSQGGWQRWPNPACGAQIQDLIDAEENKGK